MDDAGAKQGGEMAVVQLLMPCCCNSNTTQDFHQLHPADLTTVQRLMRHIHSWPLAAAQLVIGWSWWTGDVSNPIHPPPCTACAPWTSCRCCLPRPPHQLPRLSRKSTVQGTHQGMALTTRAPAPGQVAGCAPVHWSPKHTSHTRTWTAAPRPLNWSAVLHRVAAACERRPSDHDPLCGHTCARTVEAWCSQLVWQL